MSLHLHFGVTPLGLDKVTRALYEEGVTLQLNGDGWNSWGDRVGSDNNDDITMHAIVDVNDVHQARYVTTLLPGTPRNRDGNVFVLSEKENWQDVIPLDLELLNMPVDARKALELLYETATDDANNEEWLRIAREAFVLLMRTIASAHKS